MALDYLHNHPEFPELIRIVGQDKVIDPALVEKDYWIMHCLFGLQQAGMAFELKGGTSLSKGYGIIHRFSEDCQAPESRSIFSFVVGGHELTNAPSNSAVVSELISFLFQHYKRSGRTIS
jgi:hypothetical protein